MFVGIDVAKDHVDVAVRPGTRVWRVDRSQEALDTLAQELRAVSPVLVAMEATGGYEIDVAVALGSVGVPVAIVNPRQVRDFAKATGHLAKTDKIDAQVIAHFADAIRPSARALPSDEQEQLSALVGRRKQLLEIRIAEKNRLGSCRDSRARKSLNDHVSWLDKQIEEINGEIGTLVRASSLWQEKDELLQSAKGIGPTLSPIILVSIPELGKLTRKEIAALAGLAPFNCDSGKGERRRTTWGGRADARSALYMAALVASRFNPIIAAFYKKLKAAGKPAKVALVACARKLLTILNAMVRDGKPWADLSHA